MTTSYPTGAWTAPSVEEIDPFLSEYRVESLLGAGGMGAVYKGYHSVIGRQVAIKVLPLAGIPDDGMNFAERFKLEAQSMAQLSHPSILTVYGCGEAGNEADLSAFLYFVMEFVEGCDIHQFIKAEGGKVSGEHALAITCHVLDGLAYAHEKGIIHRDIKPANIMLDQHGRVKIADFGLAKQMDADFSLTMTNMAMGTPDYVAPEMLEIGKTVDGRSDLYSLGAMLYQMLTGNIPRGNFKRASEIVPGLDHRFDQIIERALQYDPDDRYPDAMAFRSDLDQILTTPEAVDCPKSGALRVGDSTSIKKLNVGGKRRPTASTDGVANDSATIVKKSPLGLVLASCVVLLLVVGAGVFALQSGKETPHPLATSKKPKQQKTEALKTPTQQGMVTDSTGYSPPAKPTKAPQSELAATPASKTAREELAEKKADPPKTSNDTSEKKPPLDKPIPTKAPTVASSEAAKTETPPAEPTPPASEPQKTEVEAKSAAPAIPAIVKPRFTVFEKLKKEQADSPYQSSLKKITANYRQQITRDISTAADSGDLSSVNGLRAEAKALTTFQKSLPTATDPASLTPLPPLAESATDIVAENRKKWDGALDTFADTHQNAVAKLTKQFADSLQNLEADLTKQRKFDEANEVAAYRLSLAKPLPATTAATMQEKEEPTTPTKTALAPPSARPLSKKLVNPFGWKPIPKNPFPLPIPKRPETPCRVVAWRLDGKPVDKNDFFIYFGGFPHDLGEVVDFSMMSRTHLGKMTRDKQPLALGLDRAGNVLALARHLNLPTWKNINVISTSFYGATAITASGKVQVRFGNPRDIPNLSTVVDTIESWENIVQVITYGPDIMALRSDGVPLGAGRDKSKPDFQFPEGYRENIVELGRASSNTQGLIRYDGPDHGFSSWRNGELSLAATSEERLFASGPFFFKADHRGKVVAATFAKSDPAHPLQLTSRIPTDFRAFEMTGWTVDQKKEIYLGISAARSGDDEWRIWGDLGDKFEVDYKYCEERAEGAWKVFFCPPYALALKPTVSLSQDDWTGKGAAPPSDAE